MTASERHVPGSAQSIAAASPPLASPTQLSNVSRSSPAVSPLFQRASVPSDPESDADDQPGDPLVLLEDGVRSRAVPILLLDFRSLASMA